MSSILKILLILTTLTTLTIIGCHKPVPFEEGEVIRAPYGCEEGRAEGVDC